MARFVFLVSNGSDTMMLYGWGEDIEEAKRFLSLNLSTTWYVVEDSSTISQFIMDNKDVTIPENVKSEWLITESKHFHSDLLELESILKKLEEPKMDKEKLLQFVSDVLDQGGSIQLSLFSFNNSEEKAKEYADRLSEIIGKPTVEVEGRNKEYQWLETGKCTENICGTFHFKRYMEEDVKLDGMPEKGDDKIA